eukprot:CAMPEP_0179318262 /NCGR_PEP_ID=MMETSP0797-20121207/56773_1 /TAXON_ID=47934 /ORGANISM="Dinophysis acuminata, Strain DAEP01" /LENGTH=311 /DNA_ID=CAMNT_0021029385 /DNA_START=130 /DNA_END=1065 /DNA_ORIENTATION=+
MVCSPRLTRLAEAEPPRRLHWAVTSVPLVEEPHEVGELGPGCRRRSRGNAPGPARGRGRHAAHRAAAATSAGAVARCPDALQGLQGLILHLLQDVRGVFVTYVEGLERVDGGLRPPDLRRERLRAHEDDLVLLGQRRGPGGLPGALGPSGAGSPGGEQVLLQALQVQQPAARAPGPAGPPVAPLRLGLPGLPRLRALQVQQPAARTCSSTGPLVALLQLGLLGRPRLRALERQLALELGDPAAEAAGVLRLARDLGLQLGGALQGLLVLQRRLAEPVLQLHDPVAELPDLLGLPRDGAVKLFGLVDEALIF